MQKHVLILYAVVTALWLVPLCLLLVAPPASMWKTEVGGGE